MNKKVQIKLQESDYTEFFQYRDNLSSFEKKLETIKLIDQTESIDVNKAYLIISDKINKEKRIYSFLTSLTRLAAALTIPLLAFAIWSLFFQKNKVSTEYTQQEITWHEVHSPAGMRSHVILPDGTDLWLNAGSRLRYSIPFIRESREVELSGEAFLDVVFLKNSPFIVKSEQFSVEVLGTQFNVDAYPENHQVNIALKEGNVKFRFHNDNGLSKYCELQPNDLLQFNKNDKTAKLKNTKIEKYIAWHQNIMILDDTPLTELASLLERWYGVDVIIASEDIKRYKFTTTFENEPLHRVLELLEICSPNISIRYSTGKPTKNANKFSPSVVMITKK